MLRFAIFVFPQWLPLVELRLACPPEWGPFVPIAHPFHPEFFSAQRQGHRIRKDYTIESITFYREQFHLKRYLLYEKKQIYG